MPKGILTTYPIEDGKFASYVLCQTIEEGEELVKLRNIGEVIDSALMEDIKILQDYSLLDDSEFVYRIKEIVHQICFISYIALSAGLISIREVLGDKGILHESIHLSVGTHHNLYHLPEIREKYRKLRNLDLGLFP